jgi:hypothetical protein
LNAQQLSAQMVGGELDSSRRGESPVNAIKINLRVYDPKTKLSRQMTLIQDL